MRRIAATLVIIASIQGCGAMAKDQAPDCGPYLYKAQIVRVIDGDTVVADVDLGFRTWRRGEHLRLEGIDAPERGTAAGRRATEALRQRFEGRKVHICTVKAKRSDKEATGSFGRYLAVIHAGGENINHWMLDTGHAVRFGN